MRNGARSAKGDPVVVVREKLDLDELMNLA